MSQAFDLTGRIALVTGGSSGIGLGIARCLAAAGAKVAIAALDDEHLTNLDPAFLPIACDVTSYDSCEAAVAATIDAFGGLDILAANAGVFPQATLDTIDADALAYITRINVGGLANCVKAALPVLKESRAGRIIATSSITGNITGYPGWAHYGATKAAQMGYVRTAAVELAPYGITVNAVLPGNILTGGLEGLSKDYLKQMAAAVPSGKLGSPEDIGHAVAFLASDGAGFINGHGIVVDGGQILPE
ncbi:SDR family oxidoreductase [Corynebacterium sp. H128]|uniref:SDR family oxidoreductase n=1 Tax=Corynebacterium sp. H128 TaxID=3133427 RepID=UPI00309571FA